MGLCCRLRGYAGVGALVDITPQTEAGPTSTSAASYG